MHSGVPLPNPVDLSVRLRFYTPYERGFKVQRGLRGGFNLAVTFPSRICQIRDRRCAPDGVWGGGPGPRGPCSGDEFRNRFDWSGCVGELSLANRLT
jgi:hypothetical protein